MAAETKHSNIIIRVSETDKATIARRATEAGFKSVSAYMLHMATGGTKKAQERFVLAELSRQIGACLMAAKQHGWDENVTTELREATRLVREALGMHR